MPKAIIYSIMLTYSERKALLEAVRIGMEDGSLEPWGVAARRAASKLKAATPSQIGDPI